MTKISGIANTILISMSSSMGLGKHQNCLTVHQRIYTLKWEFIARPLGTTCGTFARVGWCLYLLKFVGTDRRKKYVLWFVVSSQLLVNLATVIQVVTQCHEFVSFWDPTINGHCSSMRVQEYMGITQGA